MCQLGTILAENSLALLGGRRSHGENLRGGRSDVRVEQPNSFNPIGSVLGDQVVSSAKQPRLAPSPALLGSCTVATPRPGVPDRALLHTGTLPGRGHADHSRRAGASVRCGMEY